MLSSSSKKITSFISALLLWSAFTYAQGVLVGTTGGTPDASSVLEIRSNSQGFLPPRLTSVERDEIENPAEGLRIYNLDTQCENFFNGNIWVELCGGCYPQPTQALAGPDQQNASGNSVSLAANAPGPGVDGQWTIVSGSGGSFSGQPVSSSPTATFTGQSSTSYVLRWTLSSDCGFTQDDVFVSFECGPQPSMAIGGPDQLNVAGNSVVLAGNAPGVNETGLWVLVEGTGGNFEGNYTSTDPAATFYGTAGATYHLVWRLETACGITQDHVYISFQSPPSTPCSPATVSDIDNNEYQTVQIGNQCWMKENLRTTRLSDGTPLEYPQYDYYSWTTNTTGAYGWYNEDPSNGGVYGALYNGYAVLHPSGLCPSGWRVPTETDFHELTDYLGGAQFAGGSLKATSGWDAPNTGATDFVGFSAVPGGYRLMDGSFGALGQLGLYWTAVEYSGQMWMLRTYHNQSSSEVSILEAAHGLSVRCIRN